MVLEFLGPRNKITSTFVAYNRALGSYFLGTTCILFKKLNQAVYELINHQIYPILAMVIQKDWSWSSQMRMIRIHISKCIAIFWKLTTLVYEIKNKT